MLNLRTATPWFLSACAFAWGFAAGATAISVSQERGIDLGLAIVIAILPIVVGAFINLDRKLRQSQENNHKLRHEETALQAHCVVSMTDAAHRISYVNDKLLDTTGYSRAELVGKSASTLYFKSDRGEFQEIKNTLTSGRHWNGETRIRCKDGSILWTYATIFPMFGARGELSGTISVRTDITAVKLSASKRELFSALNKISDDVYVFEPETYRFIYMNERAMKRLGWDAQSYPTKTLHDAEPSFDKLRFDRLVAPLLESESDRVELQTNLGNKPHAITIQLIRPPVGPPRFVAFFRDVSDRVEAERIKDEFIATVSHELRSPLTSIKGALGLMLAGAVDEKISDKSRSLLDIAHRNANRLVAIVNDILDIEKIAMGKMEFNKEIAELGGLVKEAVAVNSTGAARFDVNIEAEGFEEDVFAEFDHDRMMQVLTNLLSNAMRFSHPGGKVVVSLTSDQNRHVLTVRDFGVGIPPESLPTIFDRFVQAANRSERSGKGTGLGLSIVKAIIEQHDGSISIESELNEGTAVHLCIPRKEPAPRLADQKMLA